MIGSSCWSTMQPPIHPSITSPPGQPPTHLVILPFTQPASQPSFSPPFELRPTWKGPAKSWGRVLGGGKSKDIWLRLEWAWWSHRSAWPGSSWDEMRLQGEWDQIRGIGQPTGNFVFVPSVRSHWRVLSRTVGCCHFNFTKTAVSGERIVGAGAENGDSDPSLPPSRTLPNSRWGEDDPRAPADLGSPGTMPTESAARCSQQLGLRVRPQNLAIRLDKEEPWTRQRKSSVDVPWGTGVSWSEMEKQGGTAKQAMLIFHNSKHLFIQQWTGVSTVLNTPHILP